jgi:hypothetical protein
MTHSVAVKEMLTFPSTSSPWSGVLVSSHSAVNAGLHPRSFRTLTQFCTVLFQASLSAMLETVSASLMCFLDKKCDGDRNQNKALGSLRHPWVSANAI